MKMLPLSEFENCANPITARASFYLGMIIDEVAEEYGCLATATPISNMVKNASAEISFVSHNEISKFVIMHNGNIVKVKKIACSKTGSKIYNDDIQILDEIQTDYTLEYQSCGPIEGFIESCETMEGIENIACQAIMIIEDNLNTGA